MLKKKSLDEIDNNISDVIHHFSVQSKVKFLGSNSYKGLLYASDFDIVSKITEPAEALANHFKKLFAKPSHVYLMDFKAGLKDDEKLRWTKMQLAKGINQGILLKDAIKMDTLIKLDFIVENGNSFVEISEIYDTKYQTKKTKKQIETELEDDIDKYVKENNSMKSLKRLYSLLKLQKGHEKMKDKLVKFFNSDVGLVNKVANDLDLLLLLTSKYTVPFKTIYNNTQMLKQNASVVQWINVSQFNEITAKNYKNKINEIVLYLRKKINLPSKVLLHEFKQ